MQSDGAKARFTRSDGSYAFARWARPIVPVVFGLEPETLAVYKAALTAVAGLTGRGLVASDPEMGINLLVFALRNWTELHDVPEIDALVSGLVDRTAALEAAAANQYRLFRFEPGGSIRAAFLFLRFDAALAAMDAADLALEQAVRLMLLWSDSAFVGRSALALLDGGVLVRPDIAAVIRAAYDPVLPDAAADVSHALRLAARMELAGIGLTTL